jgi:type-F conjugative transfer system pilin assembly protein TrbC
MFNISREITRLIKIIAIAIAIITTQIALSHGNEQDLVDGVLNSPQYKNFLKQADTITNSNSKQIAKYSNDAELKTVISNKEKQIFNKAFGDAMKGKKNTAPQSNIMVFISLSMPKESLQNYYVEAKQFNTTLLIRGFIDDSLSKTVSYFKTAQDEGVMVQVDPHSFEKFNITQVPTIIIKDGKCLPNTSCAYDKITGNVSLRYALEKIEREGEFGKRQASKTLQGGSR